MNPMMSSSADFMVRSDVEHHFPFHSQDSSLALADTVIRESLRERATEMETPLRQEQDTLLRGVRPNIVQSIRAFRVHDLQETARVLGQLKYGGSIASVGLAGGSNLPASVVPFLLRGVNILGIDSVLQPYARRVTAWDRIARDMPKDKSEAMVTLSLVLTALFFCVLNGMPLGIWLARSERANRVMRPLLDAMQTTPAFVYLVPVVMLFGIGNVPGVIVTIIFALAPLVRLTNLGIRQVRPDLVEAAQAYGASPWQLLTRVQIPLAMPSIMAGVNQTLMLSLSMVVIASMIAVGGLGLMVLRGIGRLDMGLAAVGGLGIVILAIVLDRVTQALGQPRRDQHLRWYMRGPVGLGWRLLHRRHDGSGPHAPGTPTAPSAPPTAPAPNAHAALSRAA